MPEFRVVSDFSPAGDQPAAIDGIVEAFQGGEKAVTLLGATGTGKTFTAAKALERIQRPALVMAPNKTLAAQLANEFREFLPDNAVEYFVSYYDYYQPEAYIASSDTYIEKDSSINDEIDRLRHRATAALFARRDVVVVASVSCIYGLGNPAEWEDHVLFFKTGKEAGLQASLRKLVSSILPPPAVSSSEPVADARDEAADGEHGEAPPRPPPPHAFTHAHRSTPARVWTLGSGSYLLG